MEGTTVLIRGGLIEQLGQNVAIPSGLPVIDGRGKTLLPGFIDAHTHTRAEASLADEIRFGVTTKLDMSSPVEFASSQRARRTTIGGTPLPDLWSAGTLVTSPGGLGADTDYPTISNPNGAAAFVRARIAEGSASGYDPGVP